MDERGDIIRTMQRAMSGQQRELAVFQPGDDGSNVISRVAAKGLSDDCTTEAIWSSAAWTAKATTSP